MSKGRPHGSGLTMKRNSTWKQTSKIVDMPSMKLNYAIHSHTVSEYDRYKIRNWSKSQHQETSSLFNDTCHYLLNPTTFPVKESIGFSCKHNNDTRQVSKSTNNIMHTEHKNCGIILPSQLIDPRGYGKVMSSYSNVLCT